MTQLSTSGSTAPVPADARPRGPLSAFRSFFRYHGLLAPAVRLLRNLPFHGKIGVVAMAFGASTMVLAVAYQQQVLRSQAAIERQVAGLIQTRALIALQDALVQRRQAIAPTNDPMALLQAARKDLPLGSPVGWDALQTAWQAASRGAAGGGDDRQALLAAMDAVRAFQVDVATDAGLGRFGLAADGPVTAIVAHDLPTLRAASLRLLDQVLAAPEGAAAASSPSADLLARRWIVAEALDVLQGHLRTLPADVPSAVRATGDDAVTATRLLLDRLGRGGDAAELAAQRSGDVAVALAALRAQSAFESRLGDVLSRSMQAQVAEGQRALVVTAGTVVALLVVGVYLLVGFHKVMAGGLRNLSAEVRRMAAGDLSARPKARGHDEVATALVSLGGSLTLLSEMFATVRQGVASVAQASGDIARGNGDLAERTERTTRQLEQVVASVNLYMEQLEQSAQRVDEAAHLVEAMRMDAARSRHNMARLQARMNDLQGKSREIGAIVNVIDNIAFRTNVLALNASIEAAKAGETGRGFAVVAQEVRRLARRSAESARDIQGIVTRSTEDIVQGATLADRTGEALRETDLHVARVHESMQQIVQLTRGGEANSRTILQSIHELNRLTDENNQLVEQIAQASVALSGSGDELSRRVASFKLT